MAYFCWEHEKGEKSILFTFAANMRKVGSTAWAEERGGKQESVLRLVATTSKYRVLPKSQVEGVWESN